MIVLLILFWVAIGFCALALLIPGKIWPNPNVPTRNKRRTLVVWGFIVAAVLIIIYTCLT